MSNGVKKSRITEEDFNNIKTLQKHGLKAKEIREFTKRGEGTVWLIMHTETYQDYINKRRSWTDKPKRVVRNIEFTEDGVIKPIDPEKSTSFTTQFTEGGYVDIPKQVQVVTPVISNEIAEELRNVNKTLIRLCVAWETVPTKKKWLK